MVSIFQVLYILIIYLLIICCPNLKLLLFLDFLISGFPIFCFHFNLTNLCFFAAAKWTTLSSEEKACWARQAAEMREAACTPATPGHTHTPGCPQSIQVHPDTGFSISYNHISFVLGCRGLISFARIYFLFVFQALFARDAYSVIIPSHKCHKCKETFLLMLKKQC